MTSFTPPDGLHRDELLLAPYAMATCLSKGRNYLESNEDPFRPLFQRDRERVVHCRSFRRLMTKTQVLAAHTNDHHRTRLTHSLEVAQISRTIARLLGLNEDLIEAIALSHDLGHPPFGHAGESALDECTSDAGGFDHNLHAIRIVEVLETPYPAFPGLNLSWEVREAMAYHSKRREQPAVGEFTAAGQPLLEAQVVDAADSLAYTTHDLDDALGTGLLAIDDLAYVEFWRVGAESVRRRAPGIAGEQYRPAVVRALIEWQVTDLVTHTGERLRSEKVESVADVRRVPDLVGWSPRVKELKSRLEQFLRERVYRHQRVLAMADSGRRCVRGLFAHFLACPEDLPKNFARRIGDDDRRRVVCDYLAGMTDRFARQEHQRLCPAGPSI